LMLALGSPFKAGESMCNAELNGLDIAGLEVQPGNEALGSPISAEQGVAMSDVECRCNGGVALLGQYDDQVLRHGLPQLLEKAFVQIWRIAVLPIRSYITVIEKTEDIVV